MRFEIEAIILSLAIEIGMIVRACTRTLHSVQGELTCNVVVGIERQNIFAFTLLYIIALELQLGFDSINDLAT